MGLFDEVYVPDELLTALGRKGGTFQSCSLPGPYLNHYRIAVDARLEKWCDENRQWVVIAHHGDILFYRITACGWEEYIARFTDSCLAWIRQHCKAAMSGKEG